MSPCRGPFEIEYDSGEGKKPSSINGSGFSYDVVKASLIFLGIFSSADSKMAFCSVVEIFYMIAAQ